MVSNIGGWMYNVASGWLMTSLDPNAFIVSMVQVANSLPMFLFAIPAGALADIVNQRRFLIVGESMHHHRLGRVCRTGVASSDHAGQFARI